MKKLIAALLVAFAASAHAQSVQQTGNITPGHVAAWATNGVIKDGGTAANGNLTSLGVMFNGSGICQNSGVITGAYNQLCFDVTPTGASLDLFNHGGATGSFALKLNGSALGLATVQLPVTIGDASCFSNTSGNLLDCSFLPLAQGGLGGSQAGAVANSVPVFPGSGGPAVPTVLSALQGAILFGNGAFGYSSDALRLGWDTVGHTLTANGNWINTVFPSTPIYFDQNGVMQPGKYATPQMYGSAGTGGDDLAFFNSAVASGKVVVVPCGAYKVSGTIPLTSNGSTVTGASSACVTITATNANLPIFSVADGLTVSIMGLTLNRNVNATSGGNGITAEHNTAYAIFRDLDIVNQYIGLKLGPTADGSVLNVNVSNSFSHNVYIANDVTAGAALQWHLYNVESGTAAGDCFHIEAVTGGATTGDFNSVVSYACSGHGFAGIGTASFPLNGVRISTGFFGSAGASNVYLDTYAGFHDIVNVTTELAGQTTTGRNQATSASNVGNGIEITANNSFVNIVGGTDHQNSLAGIKTQSAETTITSRQITQSGAAGSQAYGVYGPTAGKKIYASNVTSGNESGSIQAYGYFVADGSDLTVVGGSTPNNGTAAIGATANLTSVGQVLGTNAVFQSSASVNASTNTAAHTLNTRNFSSGSGAYNIFDLGNDTNSNRLEIGVTSSTNTAFGAGGDGYIQSLGQFNIVTSIGTVVGLSAGVAMGSGTINAQGLYVNGTAVTAAGITALTGDVTATGPGSVAATLATAQPAVHTWALAQTFTVAPNFSSLTGVILGNGASAATAQTGTANYLLKWTGSTGGLSGTSLVYDNGTVVGVGLTPTGCVGGDFNICNTGASTVRFRIGNSSSASAFDFAVAGSDVYAYNLLSGNFFLGVNNATVLQLAAGAVTITGTVNPSGAYYAAGTKGVTCSGALTVIASITIKNGIITAASGTGGTCS